MSHLIRSILDTDLYKLSMQQAVLELCPDIEAEYVFVNRRLGVDKFDQQFVGKLQSYLDRMGELALTPGEHKYLCQRIPWFKPTYIEYLKNYRFDPDEVKLGWDNDNLTIAIKGKWSRTILWEVPLMAMISELWFSNWNNGHGQLWSYDDQDQKATEKARRLILAGCNFTDFGTRRRRSWETQEIVCRNMANEYARIKALAPNTCAAQVNGSPLMGRFIGTSNVMLAMRLGLTPIGTMAHEWIQGWSILGSMIHANRDALAAWHKVYDGELGIALTDTFGTDSFFRDFGKSFARLYDGIRHDSGDPFKFADKAIAHYNSLRIDPSTKTIIFSDSLDVDLAIKLNEYCFGKGIRCSFGIGTHFTNDFEGVLKALNMVIKLVRLGGYDVVKLSDDPRKAIGTQDAIRIARYLNMAIPLNAPMDTPFVG